MTTSLAKVLRVVIAGMCLIICTQVMPQTVSADANETAVAGPNAGAQSSISSGRSHTCVLMSTGGVKCWGSNNSGELGDDTNAFKMAPTQVSGLTSGVTAISAGYLHTCALLSTGGVKCWGSNSDGQLGDNTITSKNVPTQVSGLTSDVTAISSGYSHSCALLSTGAVKCWGGNWLSQLGDGTTDDRSVPTQVSGLTSGVTAISVGRAHTCALLSTGAVKCWGFNQNGQLGNGNYVEQNLPTQVSDLTSGVTAISAGHSHTCALMATGAMTCWGSNWRGQLGINSSQNFQTIPSPVPSLTSGVTTISTRHDHTCALLSTGAVMCWGINYEGQLGDGSTDDKLVPTQVPGLTSGATAIATSESSTCALLSAGTVTCWGYNNLGQLGNGTDVEVILAPTLVVDLNGRVGPMPVTSAPSSSTTVVPSVAVPSESVVNALPVAAQPLSTKTSFVAGGEVAITSGGFTPLELVQLIVASTPQLMGSSYANAQGVVTLTGSVPRDLSAGAHSLVVYAPGSGIGFRQSIVVTSLALPATGNGSTPLMVALVVMLVGVVIAVMKRRLQIR